MPSRTLGARPKWLTFDCYGTLIQWDEGLTAAVARILAKHGGAKVDAAELIRVYDGYEHALEEERPHRSFRDVAAEGLRRAMKELGLGYEPQDGEILTSSISDMPPFPEVVPALGALKRQGHRLCIISNTDDDIIAGNVAQLGGHIDRVITAQQAQAYKPSPIIFGHAPSGARRLQGRGRAYLREPASRSRGGARYRLSLHLDRSRHRPQGAPRLRAEPDLSRRSTACRPCSRRSAGTDARLSRAGCHFRPESSGAARRSDIALDPQEQRLLLQRLHQPQQQRRARHERGDIELLVMRMAALAVDAEPVERRHDGGGEIAVRARRRSPRPRA